jgi:hypothetical protein
MVTRTPVRDYDGVPVGLLRLGAGNGARTGGRLLTREESPREARDGAAKTLVKKSTRSSERYNLMVFPDNGRWFWFVTFASTIPRRAVLGKVPRLR